MSNQKPRTIDEQVRILSNRGMEFKDEELAKSYLQRISYFRLKYYWIDMIDEEVDDFKKDSSFEAVIERYEFDRELRQILFKAIEMLEIGLRTKIITSISIAIGSGLWYLNKDLFENTDYHEDFVLDLKYEFGRSTEPFAWEYIRDHNDWNEESLEGDNPDAWMILETAHLVHCQRCIRTLRRNPLFKQTLQTFLDYIPHVTFPVG